MNPASYISKLLISSENIFLELVIPHSDNYSPYLLYNFKNLFLILAYKDTPMKSNWCNICLCLEESSKKYFSVLIDSVGAQLSPIISLFYKSLLTRILNFNFSRLPSDLFLSCGRPCMVSLGIPFLGSPLGRSDC